jgi:hypothetical protein
MTTQWKLSTALVVVALAFGCGGPGGPEDKAAWDAAMSKDGAGQLDGQRFECESGLKGKSADEKETLEFHGGRFHSVGCDEYRFETGAYTATRSAETVGFQSTTKSPTEGSIVWTGYVRGTEIEGTFVWTKTGQAPVDYWFKGKRAK